MLITKPTQLLVFVCLFVFITEQIIAKKKTRILWFSACALAIFAEYTAWTAFGGILFTEYTAWAAFGERQEVLWRFALFVISQSEYANEVLKYTNEAFSMHIYNNRAHG